MGGWNVGVMTSFITSRFNGVHATWKIAYKLYGDVVMFINYHVVLCRWTKASFYVLLRSANSSLTHRHCIILCNYIYNYLNKLFKNSAGINFMERMCNIFICSQHIFLHACYFASSHIKSRHKHIKSSIRFSSSP